MRREIDWPSVLATVSPLILPLWFGAICVVMVYNYGTARFLLLDIAVYREAAQAALSGGDPWRASVSGLTFAGPPPTLLLFVPLAFVSIEVATVVMTGVLAAAAVWSIRRLGLPLWWILFPPVFESLIVGNPDVLVLALLLARGPVAGLAAVAKVYAVIPLLAQRRWGALLLGAAVSALTLPLWPAFLASIDTVAGSLDAQSEGVSAWGTWWMVPAVAALWALRRRGAEWLVVPAIWPHTQTHYGALSLPVMRHYPLAAAIIGLGTPLAPAIAVIVVALQVRLGIGGPARTEEPG